MDFFNDLTERAEVIAEITQNNELKETTKRIKNALERCIKDEKNVYKQEDIIMDHISWLDMTIDYINDHKHIIKKYYGREINKEQFLILFNNNNDAR